MRIVRGATKGQSAMIGVYVPALLSESICYEIIAPTKSPYHYVPRVEPAPPDHAVKMDHFRDVWILRGKYVAFVLMGERFRRSPAFMPESAQRWANQIRQKVK